MAQKIVLSSGKSAYVTNRMADGSVRDSMEGFVLHEATETRSFFDCFYNVLQNITERETEAGRSGTDDI